MPGWSALEGTVEPHEFFVNFLYSSITKYPTKLKLCASHAIAVFHLCTKFHEDMFIGSRDIKKKLKLGSVPP